MGSIYKLSCLASIVLSFHHGFGLALNIPLSSCTPEKGMTRTNATCITSALLGPDVNSRISRLNVIPIPPAPFEFDVPSQNIRIILTNYGSQISQREARDFIAEWLREYKDQTQDDPRREHALVRENQRWSAGAVALTLGPRLTPVPAMRWGDIYSLIVVMLNFVRVYGLIEADFEIRGIFPDRRRPDIILGTADITRLEDSS